MSSRSTLPRSRARDIPEAVLLDFSDAKLSMGILYRKRDSSGRPYGNWIAQYKAGGRKVRKSTLTRNKQLARRVLAKYEAEEFFPAQIVAVPGFASFADEYLDWSAANKRASTWSSERRILRRMTERWADLRLDHLDPATIQKYVQERRKGGVKAASVNREMSLLKSVLGLAVLRRKLAYLPELPRLRESDSETRSAIPSGSIGAVLDHLDERARLAVLIMYHTGIRRSSVCRLTWDRIDLSAGVIRLEPSHTKQGRAHLVYLSDELLAELESESPKDRSARLWPHHPDTLTHLLRDAMLAAGVYRKGSVCHALRRLFATEMLARTDSKTVQELGGWSSLSMVERYASSSEERQRRAVKGRTAAMRPKREISG